MKTKENKIMYVRDAVSKDQKITKYLISKNTTIPATTVGRIIEGKTKNPSIRIVDEMYEFVKNKDVIFDEIKSEAPYGSKLFYNSVLDVNKTVEDSLKTKSPTGYAYSINGIEETEVLLRVSGFSMEPKVKEQSIIGVRSVDKNDPLNTSKIYFIITKTEKMINFIEHDQQDDSFLWCVSPNFQKFKILKSKIIDIKRVTLIMNIE